MPDGLGGEKKSLGERILPGTLTIGIITAMVLCAEVLQEKEIIFPEIAAISVGYLLSPRRGWMTNSLRIFILIAICSLAGLGIVLFLPLPLYGQIMVAFALSQLIYIYSGTTFAPLVSALVLPVILQTRSVIYPLSACVLTLLILLCRLLLQKTGIRQTEVYHPLPVPGLSSYLDVLKRLLCVAILAFVALRVHWTYLIAPPLLVAFTEFSNPDGKARKNPISAILLITMCALAGASCRMVLCERLQLPLTLAALLAAAFMNLFLGIFDLYLPPAGAATLLAMLIPADALLLYPVEIFLGVSILMGASCLLFGTRRPARTK